MSEINSEGRKDEIDLIDLFGKLWKSLVNLFAAAGRFLLRSIFFLIGNLIPLLASIILGFGLSHVVRTAKRPYYISEITLKSNAVDNGEMIPYMNKLTQLVKEKNFPTLAKSLNLPVEAAKKIRKIQAFWVIDKNNDSIPDFVDYKNNHNVYDTVNVRMKDRFVITTIIYDPNDLPLIRDGLVRYADDNPFFQEKNVLRLKQTDEMLIRLNYDIKELDSLQKVKYFEETRNRQTGKDGQIIFFQEQKTQLVYSDIYNLYRIKLEYDRQKDLFPGILTVISDFLTPIKRSNGTLYYSQFIVPSLFFLTLLILIYARNREKIKSVYKKYR